MYQDTAQFLSLFQDSNSESLQRVGLIQSFLPSGSRSVLDIGAGHGEMALLIAECGHRVHCLEPSRSSHALLLEKVARRPDLQNRISIYASFLENLCSSLDVDLAYASSVFSHLDFYARLSLLKRLREHLRPSGTLIFNVVRQVTRPDKPLTLRGEKKIGDVTYRHFDSAEQLSSERRRVKWRFEIESKAQGLTAFEEDFILNLDTDESLKSLLSEAGYECIAEFGSWAKAPVASEQTGRVIVAKLV